MPWLVAGGLAVAWAAIVPITLLSHRESSLWLHLPLMAISLGILTLGAAVGGISAAELLLRRRQGETAGKDAA